MQVDRWLILKDKNMAVPIRINDCTSLHCYSRSQRDRYKYDLNIDNSKVTLVSFKIGETSDVLDELVKQLSYKIAEFIVTKEHSIEINITDVIENIKKSKDEVFRG